MNLKANKKKHPTKCESLRDNKFAMKIYDSEDDRHIAENYFSSLIVHLREVDFVLSGFSRFALRKAFKHKPEHVADQRIVPDVRLESDSNPSP
mmetsp:Transcript_31987/g.51889  ORF Transcript_31987/g.51889 Transcript_31987/m.51889 type:complete len:93 (+) Transcript_31987:291-569(+)